MATTPTLNERDTLEAAIALSARNSIHDYARVMLDDRYPHKWFHQQVCDALEALDKGDILRLMVFMQPRFYKSMLCSIIFTSWFMGRHPGKAVISTAYGDRLSRKHSRKTLRMMRQPLYNRIFPGTVLDPKAQATDEWYTTEGGGLISAGIGGGITGTGGDLIIIDDPVKGAKQAASEVERETAWEWYLNDCSTRLEKPGRMVMPMTRWPGGDDLASRILNSVEAKHWHIIRFPAIADGKEDYDIRDIGDPLWPDKVSLEELEMIRERNGPYNWAALYQQDPQPQDGRILDSRKIVLDLDLDNLPEYDRIVISWDTAFEKHSQADWSVGTVWGQTPTAYHLLDVMRGRWTFPTLKTRVVALYDKWTLTLPKDADGNQESRTPDSVIVEQAASGRDIIHELRANTNLPIIAIKVKNDKIARANGVCGRFEAGRVHAPARAPWLADVFNELDYFPNGANDDIVDSVVHALRYMTRTSGSALA